MDSLTPKQKDALLSTLLTTILGLPDISFLLKPEKFVCPKCGDVTLKIEGEINCEPLHLKCGRCELIVR